MAALSRRQVLTVITLLSFFNFLWLFTHFTHHSIPIPVNFHFHLRHDVQRDPRPSNTAATTFSSSGDGPGNFNATATGRNRRSRLPFSIPSRSNSKPWPVLPSFLPWSLDSLGVPRAGSCEAYFGNGFTRIVDILVRSRRRSDRGCGGWFRCHNSETLRSSICEGGKVRMNLDRVRMSKGEEKIEDEVPIFEPGAFQLAVTGASLPAGAAEDRLNGRRKLVTRKLLDKFVPHGGILRRTMQQLVDSIELVGESEFYCSEWIEEPALLVTCSGYANVVNAYAAWYSAYVSARVTGLPRRPHVIFVDDHCQTQLEEAWKALFSSLTFAKNFTGPVCFRHAIFVPPGDETALAKGLTETIDCQGASAHSLWANPDDSKTARLSEFGEMLKAAFGFQMERQRSLEPTSGDINILFIQREVNVAHPHHSGRVESGLHNEQELFDYLKSWASSNISYCKVNLINGLFAQMSMKDQIRAIQEASVVVAPHGAGLTHMFTALPKTLILEIISTDYERPHSRLIAQSKGLEYHTIKFFGSYAEHKVVVDQLNGILKGMRC